jgi:hypothetical protein
VKLAATEYAAAFAECRSRGFRLFEDEEARRREERYG